MRFSIRINNISIHNFEVFLKLFKVYVVCLSKVRHPITDRTISTLSLNLGRYNDGTLYKVHSVVLMVLCVHLSVIGSILISSNRFLKTGILVVPKG